LLELINMNKSLTMAKTNFKLAKTPLVLTLLFVGANLINQIIMLNIDGVDSGMVSTGNIFILYAILIALFIPLSYFRRLISLGIKKKIFFRGTTLTYIITAVILAIINIIIYYIETAIVGDRPFLYMNILNVFNWFQHGVIGCFLYQFTFYILLMNFINLLAISNDGLGGWIISAVAVTIISVSTPIKPLRNAFAAFLQALLFNPNLFLQILYTIILTTIMAYATRYFIRRKSL